MPDLNKNNAISGVFALFNKRVFLGGTLIISILIIVFSCELLDLSEKENSILIFEDNFDDGLNKWKTKGKGIKVINTKLTGKAIQISQNDMGDFRYIYKDFTGNAGKLTFEALIKSTNVAQGTEVWQCGKFQNAIFVDGIEQEDHPHKDFNGTFKWSSLEFDKQGLDGSETVRLRIGLQNVIGTITVDNIKVTSTSN